MIRARDGYPAQYGVLGKALAIQCVPIFPLDDFFFDLLVTALKVKRRSLMTSAFT